MTPPPARRRSTSQLPAATTAARAVVACCVLLALTGGALAPARAAAATAGVPADVADAQDKSLAWLNTFKGKTEAEVVQLLGPPGERGTWKLKDHDELKLRYDVGKKAKMSVLFFKGKVVKADLLVMSE